MVWAHERGDRIGHTLIPLYPTVPEAALARPELHELLALVDAIRVGGARDIRLATELLEQRLR